MTRPLSPRSLRPERFRAAGYGGVFLELLEPYILKNRLTSLNPVVMQAFVEHYRSLGMVPRVEQCILRMDIASLDFQQGERVWVDERMGG